MTSELPLHALLPRPAWWYGREQKTIETLTTRVGKLFARHPDAVERFRAAIRESIDPNDSMVAIGELRDLAETPEQDAAVARFMHLAGDAAISAMARWSSERDDLNERHLPLRKDGEPRSSTNDALNGMHPQSILAGCVPSPSFHWMEDMKCSRSALAMAALYWNPIVGDRSGEPCSPEVAHLSAALELEDEREDIDAVVGGIEARLVTQYGPHLPALLTTTNPVTAYHAGSVADWVAAQGSVMRACGLETWARMQAIHTGRNTSMIVRKLKTSRLAKQAAMILACERMMVGPAVSE